MPLPSVIEADMTLVRNSGFFSAEWYVARYPDVALSGIDPLTHFLSFGTLLGRDPGPNFSSLYHREHYGPGVVGRRNALVHHLCNPDAQGQEDRVLMAAGRLAATGQPEQALDRARRDLPMDLRHSAAALEANLAIARHDLAGWEAALNRYLAHYGQVPLKLDRDAATMLERLACAPLPTVAEGPLVSVLMAVWNCDGTVEAAISSILAQTWRPLELLIVDDASTDRTWNTIQRMAARDGRIRCWRNGRNVGPYVSKNLALRHARGDFVTGHDGDDWAHPQRLAHHVGYMLTDGQALPVTGLKALRMQPDGTFTYLSRARTAFSDDGFLRHAPISFMFRQDFLIQTLGFWDNVRFGGDTELSRRAQAATGGPVPERPFVGMICL
ncbi:glycosyltransferase family 2 protein, partial [Loktanella sp. DJP18]|uniref:glycosyltransferase family 2 protein n=1 Tax=Loktanella sp. DJP18 TaxID=3409788 RepID=UPI003BB5F1AC